MISSKLGDSQDLCCLGGRYPSKVANRCMVNLPAWVNLAITPFTVDSPTKTHWWIGKPLPPNLSGTTLFELRGWRLVGISIFWVPLWCIHTRENGIFENRQMALQNQPPCFATKTFEVFIHHKCPHSEKHGRCWQRQAALLRKSAACLLSPWPYSATGRSGLYNLHSNMKTAFIYTWFKLETWCLYHRYEQISYIRNIIMT